MKVLFLAGLVSETEIDLFRKLADWIGDDAALIRPGEVVPFQPDVLVHLHNALTPQELNRIGIFSTPLRICYLMGQTRNAGGMALWNDKFVMFNDQFFGYGDMVQRTLTPGLEIGFLPLPIDVTEVPVAGDGRQQLRCCHLVSRFWKNSDEAIRSVREAGLDVEIITGQKRAEALQKLAEYPIHLGNFNYGNLGKADLEAMTAGLCCTGWLKESVRADYEALGPDLPFVDVSPGNVGPQLAALSLEQAKQIGARSRAWMLSHYRPEELAAVWKSKLAACLN